MPNIYTVEKKKKANKVKSPNSPTNKTGETRERYPNDPLTRDEAAQLLKGIDNLEDHTLILLGLYTGMRISEISSLEEISINQGEGRIHIWDEKKNKYRDVYVPDEVLAHLKRYIGTLEGRKGPKIFDCSHKTIERKIQKWTTKILGKTKSWHAIRHTYISLSREMGIAMEIVMCNTGDTASTILKYYSKPSPEYMRTQVNSRRIYDTI